MCFSAEADFAVAAAVAPVGVASLRAAARPQELLLAALPLLLALHQLTEGVVWLGLQGVAMVDAIDAQIAPLERELRQLARRQTGCRA